jgi:hypothetical protein
MSAPEDPVSSSANQPDALERAQARLDEACARVAARLDELAGGRAPQEDGALRAELSQSRAREAELAEAAQEASSALSGAIAELRVLRGDRE